jgi:GT2 family glycosyltransferase
LRARSFGLSGGQGVTAIEAAGNLGYGGGINVALAAIAGRPGWRGVWVVNPDTEPEPEALSRLLAYTEAGGYGLVGCRVVFKGSGIVQTRGGTWRRWIGRGLGLGIGDPRDATVDVALLERRLDWISGAAMYATRGYVERVGPMDDRYFLYCEDVDWSLRRGSFRLGYAHDAVVLHEHGTTIGSSVVHGARSALSIYLMERNRLLLTRQHFPGIYPVVLGLCLLGLGQSYLIKGNWSGFATGMKGWLAGVRGEVGPPPKGAV